ncbi:hypothetical protein BY996DRAFT_6443521 [Phakopsora pachyrhizi]|nr:hypothetical protein BY996DRAFT_6443521 [Phakopsora pachyrhizi]
MWWEKQFWEVSVGLVRGQAARKSGKGESQRPKRRTDIWGISKAVVGRAVGEDCWAGARRRHTEVRSSYHFRVRTEVNSTAGPRLCLVSRICFDCEEIKTKHKCVPELLSRRVKLLKSQISRKDIYFKKNRLFFTRYYKSKHNHEAAPAISGIQPTEDFIQKSWT